MEDIIIRGLSRGSPAIEQFYAGTVLSKKPGLTQNLVLS